MVPHLTKQSNYDGFCVYIHKRPDGEPFYIGKGRLHRAYDFAPSRRTIWHKNIVSKYGRDSIIVQVIPCLTEKEAFELEKAHILIAKSNHWRIANLTTGGEGAAGRKPNEKQLAGLKRGREVGKRGTPGPRPQLTKWIKSEAGKLHLEKLAQIGKEKLHSLRVVKCAECGNDFETKSAKAKCCSRLCEQRNRRKRQK